MHRTQISLDEPLYEAVRRRAFERRISMSRMVRDALAYYLVVGEAEDTKPSGKPERPALAAGRSDDP